MEFINALAEFYNNHSELILLIISAVVIPLIRSTKWGHANEEALESVMEVIENANDSSIKEAVRVKALKSNTQTAKAIERMAEKVDPKRTPAPLPTMVQVGNTITGRKRKKN
jgi:hypothetical protein